MMVNFRFLVLYLTFSLLLLLLPQPTFGREWQWSDFVIGGRSSKESTTSQQQNQEHNNKKWLTMSDVSQMRTRDIKRRLSRQYGYGADELSRILDKKELIRTLAFEEYKIQQAHTNQIKSILWKQALLVSVLAVVIVYCWPLFAHLWQVASIHLVVYYDKKLYEAKRCRELSSVWGFVGVVVMFVLDLLQIWLTVSVVLSWVMTSAYFFPVPSLPIRPAQLLMGGAASASSSAAAAAASNPISGFGINVGPMVVTWVLRFAQGRVEHWTGRALSQSLQRKKEQARARETPEERQARKAERRAARRAAREAEVAEQHLLFQQYQYSSGGSSSRAHQHNDGDYDDGFPLSSSSVTHAIWPIDEDNSHPTATGREDETKAVPTHHHDDRTNDIFSADNENDITHTPWDDLD